MPCRGCASNRRSSFGGEVAIHFPGMKGLNKPIVWVFPKLLVCLDCGLTEFIVPEGELRVLAQGASAVVQSESVFGDNSKERQAVDHAA